MPRTTPMRQRTPDPSREYQYCGNDEVAYLRIFKGQNWMLDGASDDGRCTRRVLFFDNHRAAVDYAPKFARQIGFTP